MVDPEEIPRDKPIILFDGICNLCNNTVQFVMERDPEETFRFASLQSPAGQALLEAGGYDTDSFDSFVLIDGETFYTKSSAALRVARELDSPWSWLATFRFVPSPLRDAVYSLVAKTRYDVFGRRDQCLLPTPERQRRFVENGVEPAEDG